MSLSSCAGMPNHAYTRLYFPDEVVANAKDPVLMSIPEERRGTLLAEKIERDGGVVDTGSTFICRAPPETVFFDV